MPENPELPGSPDGFSRRGLMRNAAGVGAAGLAAGILLNAAAGTAEAAAPERAPHGTRPGKAGGEETLIVHVRDSRTGELDLFHGHRHHRVYDPKLSAALLHALG
jgi:hypothetical protein